MLVIPDAPALVAGARRVTWLEPDGEVETLAPALAAVRLRHTAALFCHRRATAQRLGLSSLGGFDVLELFAFARPASFAVPTARGLATALGLACGATPEDEALSLRQSTLVLLGELRDQRRDADLAGILAVMAGAGWNWAPFVASAIGQPATATAAGIGPSALGGLAVWRRLKEWSDRPVEGPPSDRPVEPAAARRRLAEMLGQEAEARPQQADFASAVSAAFARRQQAGGPSVVLAEAGTGVGKTLGYIAPASLWAESNDGTVLISTYTRNLQQQIDRELDRLYREPADKRRRVAVRKGRENYLCLLNYEAAVASLPSRPADAVLMGLLARWTAVTAAGDVAGGDLPGWVAELFGRGRVMSLTDRRGECIHSACPHYRVCFVEKTIRRARHASLVVANHALVLAHAPRLLAEAEAGVGGGATRLVFDEGHHLFEAADKAFALTLSGRSAADLRRWLVGPERGGRMRGLSRRLGDLVTEEGAEALTEVLVAAHELPGEGWLGNLAENRPHRRTEMFLAAVRRQVYARTPGAGPDDPRAGGFYGLECATDEPEPTLLTAAADLDQALAQIEAPLRALARHFARQLEEDEGTLERQTRTRLDLAARALLQRADGEIAVWRSMLRALGGLRALAAPQPESADGAFLDRFAIERSEGQDVDVALERRWIDPTRPLARIVLARAHGVVVTSATLTDATPLAAAGEDERSGARKSGEELLDWQSAEQRSGTVHLQRPAIRARMPSPFDYAAQTRILVVGDVRRDDAGQVAGAYRALIGAAGGGALGLFTSVQRLRTVHGRIVSDLEARGLMLLAQHVDAMDVATLVDIFRAEENSSLLGTDAVRDGVDVPGRSLRLIVYDRVPWPRPDLIHRARRAAFGGRSYDDLLARLRLKQAFGRLIRKADDRGVFVLLDPALPSRLTSAFPEGVAVERVDLSQAVDAVGRFLAPEPAIAGAAGSTPPGRLLNG